MLEALFHFLLLMAAAGGDADRVTQYGLLSALMAGEYDGSLTVGELTPEGDIGLGTFNGVDGEMIVVDGVVYQGRPGGGATKAPDEEKIPFAVVTRFAPETSFALTALPTMQALGERLDQEIDADAIQVVRIDGTFSSATIRALPPQSLPYRPLAVAIKDEKIVTLTEVKGTVVGFRFPTWIGGINVAGWHFHFIDADRHRGGHLLDLSLTSGAARIDAKTGIDLTAPAHVNERD